MRSQTREGGKMLSDRSVTAIQEMSQKLKNPVRLVFFTTDAGCAACPDMLDLAHAIKKKSNKIALEVYDMVMDRDKTEQYRIRQVPALVVQGAGGRLVRFYGLVEDVFLTILLDTIQAVSNDKIWFPDDIRTTLGHLEREVGIQVFVESDCPLCRPVAETAIGLAWESDFISTDIIMADDFPDLIRKHAIKKLPRTIFGANLHMDGHVTEGEFLEMIFQAEGVKVGPDRHCLVCGQSSPDLICASCKNKIQAEAVNHKIKGEKLGQTGSL